MNCAPLAARGALRSRLLAGETAIGTLVIEFDTTGIARFAASAGAEFVLFDLEHTGWSVERLRVLLAAARSAPIPALVRVPSLDANVVGRVLDVGARGIMVPAVESAEQARRLVRAARFPPEGSRRFGLIYPDLLPEGLDAAMAAANADVLLVPQIETVCGVEQVEAIAAVDGIDVLWLGPYDLTIDMGITARFDDAEYRRNVERMLRACERHGKVPGVLVESPEEGQEALAAGFRCLMYSFDAALYGEALAHGLRAVRGEDGDA